MIGADPDPEGGRGEGRWDSVLFPADIIRQYRRQKGQWDPLGWRDAGSDGDGRILLIEWDWMGLDGIGWDRERVNMDTGRVEMNGR